MSDAAQARSKVAIANRLGMHARAATVFVQTASRFEAAVKVRCGADTVDGKSIIALMTLAAGIGTEIEIEAVGHDAEPAVTALVALVADKFGEAV